MDAMPGNVSRKDHTDKPGFRVRTSWGKKLVISLRMVNMGVIILHKGQFPS